MRSLLPRRKRKDSRKRASTEPGAVRALRGAKASAQDPAALPVLVDFALDAPQSVVDGLVVALEPVGDELVAQSLQVQAQHAPLQVREHASETTHEALHLFGADDLVDRIVRTRTWKHVPERTVAAVSYTHLTLPTKRIV